MLNTTEIYSQYGYSNCSATIPNEVRKTLLFGIFVLTVSQFSYHRYNTSGEGYLYRQQNGFYYGDGSTPVSPGSNPTFSPTESPTNPLAPLSVLKTVDILDTGEEI